jgi:hypothetical protein
MAGGVTRYTATGSLAHLDVQRLAKPLSLPTWLMRDSPAA